MPTAHDSFDPLARLFDAPPLRQGMALPPVDEDDEPEITGSMEPTDPVRFRPPPGGAARFDAPDLPPSLRPTLPAPGPYDDDDDDEVITLRHREDEPPPEPPPPEASPPEPTAEERAELARRLAAEALAKAKPAPKPVAAEPTAEERAELARRLAAEALAKAKKTAADAAPQPAPPPRAPASRLDRLARRARRPVSAADALRQAAAEEERAKVEAARQDLIALADRVGELLRRQLPGVGELAVVNAMVVDDRDLMRALWKGHRARFASDGLVDQVVSVTHVLRALDAVAPHQLIAAIVSTDRSDYLVFLDVGTQATVAAFADARAWYAGVRG